MFYNRKTSTLVITGWDKLTITWLISILISNGILRIVINRQNFQNQNNIILNNFRFSVLPNSKNYKIYCIAIEVNTLYYPYSLYNCEIFLNLINSLDNQKKIDNRTNYLRLLGGSSDLAPAAAPSTEVEEVINHDTFVFQWPSVEGLKKISGVILKFSVQVVSKAGINTIVLISNFIFGQCVTNPILVGFSFSILILHYKYKWSINHPFIITIFSLISIAVIQESWFEVLVYLQLSWPKMLALISEFFSQATFQIKNLKFPDILNSVNGSLVQNHYKIHTPTQLLEASEKCLVEVNSVDVTNNITSGLEMQSRSWENQTSNIQKSINNSEDGFKTVIENTTENPFQKYSYSRDSLNLTSDMINETELELELKIDE